MRRRIIPTLVLLSSFLSAAAAEGEKPITSKVSEVKVFLSGAQVSRTASSSVPSGTSTFVFTGLAQGIDPQSIQVTGKGGYSILSVNHRMNYLTESPKKKEIEELQAKIKKLEKDWAFEKAMQDVWANEEQVLGKNSAVGGQQNGLTATQLTAVNDYIRQRLITTKTNWLAQQEKLVSIQQEKEKLVQQMQQNQPRPRVPRARSWWRSAARWM